MKLRIQFCRHALVFLCLHICVSIPPQADGNVSPPDKANVSQLEPLENRPLIVAQSSSRLLKAKNAARRGRKKSKNSTNSTLLKSNRQSRVGKDNLPCMYRFWSNPRGHFTVNGGPFTEVSTTIDTVRSKLTGGIDVMGFTTKPDVTCVTHLLPKKIHYVWLTEPLPTKYIDHVKRMMEKNPQWTVVIWTDHPEGLINRFPDDKLEVRDVRDEMKNFRNSEIIQKEKNPAGKSAYIRLEVVYLEGGIYMDFDIIPWKRFDDLHDLFHWPFVTHTTTGSKNICNCMFGFEKGSAFLDYALDLAKENCLRFKQCGVMSGAGSEFLTGAILGYKGEDDEDISLIDQQFLLDSKETKYSVTTQIADLTLLKPDTKAGVYATLAKPKTKAKPETKAGVGALVNKAV